MVEVAPNSLLRGFVGGVRKVAPNTSTPSTPGNTNPLRGSPVTSKQLTPTLVGISGGSPKTTLSRKTPLAAKQGTTSEVLAPIHGYPLPGANEVYLRADATANYATTLTGNQPVALMIDRIKAYLAADDAVQVAEVEGRALPAAAYFNAYLLSLLGIGTFVPGSDGALTNNTQKLAYYIAMAGLPYTDYFGENVIKAAPYTGTGAFTSYAEDDGLAGQAIGLVAGGSEMQGGLAPNFVARNFTVAAVGVRQVKGFLIACATDLNTGFAIRAGNRTYSTEEINTYEDTLFEQFGTATFSITGAAAAAPAGHAVRGAPQDPFTGAAVFMLADVFDSPVDLSIVVSAATNIQIVALTEAGIDAVRAA